MPCDESWIYCHDPETKRQFPVEACWLSQTQEGQTEQIHSQIFDDPFSWQRWHDLHALGSHWIDSQQGILCWGFKGVQKRFRLKRPALFKSGQWHFHQDNAPVHNSILVTDYLTKIDTKTVPHPSYCPDLAPCDFCLFLKLKSCRYETLEEMKEAVTKVIDTLTQEDFHGALQKLLERYNCIAAGGDYFEGDKSFMCVLSIKVPIRKNDLMILVSVALLRGQNLLLIFNHKFEITLYSCKYYNGLKYFSFARNDWNEKSCLLSELNNRFNTRERSSKLSFLHVIITLLKLTNDFAKFLETN